MEITDMTGCGWQAIIRALQLAASTQVIGGAR
jgi:hypothetical protein